MVSRKLSAVKTPSRPVVAEAAIASLPVASVILPDKLYYRRMAINQRCALHSQGSHICLFESAESGLDCYPLLCDLSCGSLQPLVLVVNRVAVFKAVHSVMHLGVCATH